MKDRFTKLKYKVFGLKDPVLKKYPELLRYKPIQESKDLPAINEILTYIILLYDPNTDLNQEYPSLKDRKVEACALAGLGKAEFAEFESLNPVYTSIISCFFAEIYHNRDHREWHTTLQELDVFTNMRWEPITADTDPKKRGTLSEICDKLNAKADALEEKIFGDHSDVKEEMTIDRWSSPEKFSAPTLKLINA